MSGGNWAGGMQTYNVNWIMSPFWAVMFEGLNVRVPFSPTLMLWTSARATPAKERAAAKRVEKRIVNGMDGLDGMHGWADQNSRVVNGGT